ncbi:MAG: 6-pyruvoyl tetrahydropterin synthase family protein [Pseudomonadota bacterium]
MYRIWKEFQFSASHELHGLPDGHPCNRLHGHNYIVEVELQAESLTKAGFVIDFLKLAPFKKYLDDEFDHRHLNDVVGDWGTSSESLCKHFYDWCKERWPETAAVRVRETPKLYAEYRP